MKIPETGEYLVFHTEYQVLISEGALAIEKDSICKIVSVMFSPDIGWSDITTCRLVLQTSLEKEDICFFFNYSLHHKYTSTLPNSKATRLLYERT